MVYRILRQEETSFIKLDMVNDEWKLIWGTSVYIDKNDKTISRWSNNSNLEDSERLLIVYAEAIKIVKELI